MASPFICFSRSSCYKNLISNVRRDTGARFRNADNEPAPMLRYSKKVNGTYYVVEAVPDSSKQQLRVVSACIQKNSGSSTRLLNMEDSSSPQSTPQTPAGMATSAEDSIAQSEGSVNTDEGLIYETLVEMGVHKAAAQSLARQFDAADGLSAEVYAKGVGESFLYGMVDEINRIQELFTDGLAEAGARYKALNGQKNSASEGDARSEYGVRHSFRNSKNGMANDSLRSYNNELRNIIENQGNVIIDSYDKLVGVVNSVFDNPQDKGTAYFGILDYAILSKIEKSISNLPKDLNGALFKNNKQYSVATTFDSIRHIVDDKGLSRDDVVDYLDRLADTIAEFDTVAFDYYTDGMGKRNNGILFKKQFPDGVLQSFNLVSHKKRSISLVTIYLESGAYQKKKSAKTLPMQNAPAHTLKAGVGQTSINSVSQQASNSNTKNKNNSGTPHSDRGNISTRSILTELDASAVTNEIERKHLLEYQENSRGQLAEQEKLQQLQADLKDLESAQGKKDVKRIRFLKDEKIKTENRIKNYEGMLRREEYGKYLESLIQREVKAALATAVEKYGAIPAGERAATDRSVSIPVRMNKETKVSRVARSAAEAKMTPMEFVPKIEQAVVDGLLSYDPDTNKKQMERARTALDADELKVLKERAEFFGLDKTKDFEDFKKKYQKAAESIENSEKYGIIKRENTGAISGAYNDKNDPKGEKREAHAIRYYEELRNSDKAYFVNAVSANSSIDKTTVSKAYKHIFEDKHVLDGELKYFDPDYYMAESLRRLRTNDSIQEHDLILLRHEALEFDIMQANPETPYDEAHAIADKSHNYKKALLEWLAGKGL